MSHYNTTVIYCKGRESDDTALPSETLFLQWLCKFLDYHVQRGAESGRGDDVDASLFSINIVSHGSREPEYGEITKPDLPVECTRVELPCASNGRIVRSGVTTLLRYMVLTCHKCLPHYGFNHLLGYKETCFKACAEVSQWTEFVVSRLLPTLTAIPHLKLTPPADTVGLPADTVEPPAHIVTPSVDIVTPPADILCSYDSLSIVPDTWSYIECKLNSKQSVSTYKRNYFKTAQTDTLKYYYYQLHEGERHKFITGHLPNLIDLLTYYAMHNLIQTYGTRYMEVFPACYTWYCMMGQLPGISSAISANEDLVSKLSRLSVGGGESKSSSLQLLNSEISTTATTSTTTDRELVSKLTAHFEYNISHTPVQKIDWETLPPPLDPAKGGGLPLKRAIKKREQLENMYTHVMSCLAGRTGACSNTVVVDFCAGGGHVGILIAYYYPPVQVHLVENKEESLANAERNITALGLTNVTLYQCNLTQYRGRFCVGVTLHACGLATDLVIEQCLRSKASLVICPCCYGTVHSTTAMQLPRSNEFRLLLSTENMLTLRHSADKTELGIEQQLLGRQCMELTDLDRKLYIDGYHGDRTSHIYTMQPASCSPKNHIIVSIASRNVSTHSDSQSNGHQS